MSDPIYTPGGGDWRESLINFRSSIWRPRRGRCSHRQTRVRRGITRLIKICVHVHTTAGVCGNVINGYDGSFKVPRWPMTLNVGRLRGPYAECQQVDCAQALYVYTSWRRVDFKRRASSFSACSFTRFHLPTTSYRVFERLPHSVEHSFWKRIQFDRRSVKIISKSFSRARLENVTNTIFTTSAVVLFAILWKNKKKTKVIKSSVDLSAENRLPKATDCFRIYDMISYDAVAVS